MVLRKTANRYEIVDFQYSMLVGSLRRFCFRDPSLVLVGNIVLRETNGQFSELNLTDCIYFIATEVKRGRFHEVV